VTARAFVRANIDTEAAVDYSVLACTGSGNGAQRKCGALFTGLHCELKGLLRVSVAAPFAFRKTGVGKPVSIT